MALHLSRPLCSVVGSGLKRLSKRLCSTGQPTLIEAVPVAEAVDKIKAKFELEKVPEPELSSKYLVSHVLGEASADGYLKYADQQLAGRQLDELKRVVSCRLARVPVQYIAGNWQFRQLTLKVRPPVFIPRPETEELVDIVLQRLPQPPTSLNLLEVGPGSGNICLSLLTERDNLRITALERSNLAAELCAENAEDLGLLGHRLKIVELKVDADTQWPDDNSSKFDMLISNPPYILRKDLMDLAPEISLYEDLRALDGGAEGLDVILDIVRLAERVLVPEGKIVLEVDPCHHAILPQHLIDLNLTFSITEVLKDFNGKDRFLVLSRTL